MLRDITQYPHYQAKTNREKMFITIDGKTNLYKPTPNGWELDLPASIPLKRKFRTIRELKSAGYTVEDTKVQGYKICENKMGALFLVQSKSDFKTNRKLWTIIGFDLKAIVENETHFSVLKANGKSWKFNK